MEKASIKFLLILGGRGPSIFGDWWFVHEKIGDLVILRSCGDGDLAIFCWWFGDWYLKKLVIWWFWEALVMVIYLFFVGDFVIGKCLKRGQRTMKTVILALKILGDFKVFSWWLVIWGSTWWWWFWPFFVGDMAMRQFLLVIWWLKGGSSPPLKVSNSVRTYTEASWKCR